MTAPGIEGFTARLREVIGHESVRSFARRAEVSHTSVGQYLSGASEPNRLGLVRMAAAADVSFDWLATGNEPKHVPVAAAVADEALVEAVADRVFERLFARLMGRS